MAVQSNQEGITVILQYLLTVMESCCRDFHGYAQLLHVGRAIYNFVAGDWFLNPGTNPACPAGGVLRTIGPIGVRIHGCCHHCI